MTSPRASAREPLLRTSEGGPPLRTSELDTSSRASERLENRAQRATSPNERAENAINGREWRGKRNSLAPVQLPSHVRFLNFLLAGTFEVKGVQLPIALLFGTLPVVLGALGLGLHSFKCAMGLHPNDPLRPSHNWCQIPFHYHNLTENQRLQQYRIDRQWAECPKKHQKRYNLTHRHADQHEMLVSPTGVYCTADQHAWTWDAIAAFASAMELIANAYFAWRCLRSKRLDALVRWVEDVADVPEEDMMRWLGKFGWVAYGCCLAMGIMWAGFGQYQLHRSCWWMGAVRLYDHFIFHPGMIDWNLGLPIHFWFGFFGLGPSFYLMLLWGWTNLLMHRVCQHLVKNASSQLDDTSGSLKLGWDLLNILEKMHEVSANWSFNHAARAFSTTVLAIAIVPIFRTSKGSSWFAIPISGLLFCSVWATAAAPGYVTDMLFIKLQRKLARIAYPKSSRAHVRAVTERCTDTIQRSMMTSNMQSRADATVYAEHRAVTEMMQRIECMRKSMGMRFLGVPMTLQKATTVGFVLYSIIIFITHLPLHMQ